MRHPSGRRLPRPASLDNREFQRRALYVYQHAQKRGFEHYGVLLSEEQYRGLCDDIEHARATSLGPARSGGHLWVVGFEGRKFISIFRDGLIRTFLDPRDQELAEYQEALIRELQLEE